MAGRALLVQRSIFGDVGDAGVADAIGRWCRANLGAGVEAVVFRSDDVGAVFGVELEDGRRVAVKAHQPRQRADFLEAVHAVQSQLHRARLPVPRPLLGPKPLGNGLAVAEELVDTGDYRDAHDPRIRTAMAEMLAELVRAGRRCGRPSALRNTWSLFSPENDPWPREAHTPIFDFAATGAGAEWIDSIATKAKRGVEAGRSEEIVGHDDWSGKHFRFLGNGEVGAIYDWDSLALESEARIVGAAAATFTANPNLDVKLAPTPEETRAFLDAYFAARGRPATPAERDESAAAACFLICYTARCEHSHGRRGDFTEALAAFGADYLEP